MSSNANLETLHEQKNVSKGFISYLFSWRLKDILKFIASLLLPMALGVFTLVITLQQQELAKKQRDEDRNASRLQRLEDQQAAEKLRELEKNLSGERYQDEVLDAYIRNIGKFLENNNGSLTPNEFTATLTRAITLNAFRKLDPQRNARIIRFLHEAKQLSFEREELSLDLSTANLNNIDFRELAVDEKILKDLSLFGITLLNPKLDNIQMKQVNFDRSQFKTATSSNVQYYNVSFVEAELNHINFSSNQFDTVNFSCAELNNIVFSAKIFRNIDFMSAKLQHIDLSTVYLKDVNFRSSELRDINFSYSHIENVDFTEAKLYNADFSHASLENVTFSPYSLSNVSFSQSHFNNGKLSCREIYHANFSNLEINRVDFEASKLEDVDFSFTRLNFPDFSKGQLINVDFSFAILVSAKFEGANVSHANFQETYCAKANFDSANLSNSRFVFANSKHSSFTRAGLANVSFERANLYNAGFISTGITDRQLDSALSIQNAKASNGALLKDKNLIKNGYADCKTSLTNSWSLKSGLVSTVALNNNSKNCRFVLQSYTTGASMVQHISLLDKWSSKVWSYSQLVLRAQLSAGVRIEMRIRNINGSLIKLDQLGSDETQMNIILDEGMNELELFVIFNELQGQINNTIRWCDNIHLFIVYDAYGEFQLVVPYIPLNSYWSQTNVTVYGGQAGNAVNQLRSPTGLFIDDDQTLLIADTDNDRVIQWEQGESKGRVVAGGNGRGNRFDQLDGPTYALFDKLEDSIIICDRSNDRVVRWPRYSDLRAGDIFIRNIDCWGLAMDDQNNLYVSDIGKSVVRRYDAGRNNYGSIVAGRDNDPGSDHNRLHTPTYIFVDRKQTVYVADWSNHRVMKWPKNATEGIIAAGDRTEGSALAQLSQPNGIFVDTSGTLYVADSLNYRIVRRSQSENKTTVIFSNYSPGGQHYEYGRPQALFLDRKGNMYIVDTDNNRIQRFSISYV